jgi:hypothetical protein
VMSGTNQAHPVKIKDLRTIALKWLKLKVTQIYIVMRKLEL